MKIYFLGTGTSQGIPIIGSNSPVCKSVDSKDKRLRSSVWISWDDFSIVIDCGPDFRQQILTSGCPRIDGILYTHEHSDHTAGLDDVRPFYFLQGENIKIYAHKRVIENLTTRFEYIFRTEDKYPGTPSLDVIEVKENQAFSIGGKTIFPISAMHGDLLVFGYRIDDFVYFTDIKSIEKEELNKLKNVKILVVNCLRTEPHNTHFNLKEALEFIDLVKPERAYLTHISHAMGFHEEVQKTLPENVFLAYDNLAISF